MSSCGFSQAYDDAFSRGRGVKERRSGAEQREGGREEANGQTENQIAADGRPFECREGRGADR